MVASGAMGKVRKVHAVLVILAVAVLLPRNLAAQVPTAAIDTAGSDSTREDSLRHDATARLLSAEARGLIRVPVLPDLGSEGPKALGSRIVLDRRAIAWQTAFTVADLLLDVPGVYLWRGGWHGRPMYANYRGRGATSVSWFVDGVPFIALGPDSVGVDPGLFALALFERVEIERWPSGLRVYLFTPQHNSLSPRSRVGIATGDFKISRFQGDLEYRWRNGLGITTAAEVSDAPGPNQDGNDAHLNTGLLRAEFVPRPWIGMQVQLYRMAPLLHAYLDGTDTLGAFLKGVRNDLQVRLFARKGDEAHHLQADLLYARSAWTSDTFRMNDSVSISDSVHQQVNAGGLIVTLRRPRWSVTGTGWLRDRWTPRSFRAEAGVVPIDRLSIDGELVHEEHDRGRTSRWGGARAGLTFPLGFGIEGALRQGTQVLAPALAADRAQNISEQSIRGSWDLHYLRLSAGMSSTAGIRPYAFQPYLLVDSIRALDRTTWVDLGATLRPYNWLTFDAWYSDPKGVAPQGLPPTHSLVRGEIRSRFLRKYPSGIFELRLAGEMETWGQGVIGLDSLGAPIPLRGSTYFRMGLALKLAGFQFYWDRMNVRATRHGYVPGFVVPGLGQQFGMRWEFSN